MARSVSYATVEDQPYQLNQSII